MATSSIVLSQMKGVLQLIREVVTQLSCTKSAPNTILAISIVSFAASVEVTIPMNGLSEWRTSEVTMLIGR